MATVAPLVGEVLLLKYMLGQTSNPGVKMHLYSNNHIPQSADTISNYTEVTDAAYTPSTLLGAGWTIGSVSGVTSAYYSIQSFSLSLANNIYGYMVTDNTSNLLWSEAFDTGPVNSPNNSRVLISPTLQLQ